MPELQAEPDLVVVGRVGGAYGVAGAVRITSFAKPPENIQQYRPWLLGGGDAWTRVDVESVKAHGQGFVARLLGVTDRNRAQALAGQLIAVPRQVLPELDTDREYYWQDLVGLTVTDVAGRTLGRVANLLETGAHDVLVITKGDDETLIPFADPFVLEVDLTARTIRVDWQEPA